MHLPKYFRSIIWFADFNKVSLEADKEMILFQALEKGWMEHLKYLCKKLGPREIYAFAKVMFSGTTK
jgi:hypothetical protein